MMTEAKSLPLGVPPFKPLKLSDPITNSFQTLQHSAPTQNIVKKAAIYQDSNTHANHMTNSGQLANTQKMVNNMKYPAFQALPSSVSRVSTGQIIHVDTADKMSQQMSQVHLNFDQLHVKIFTKFAYNSIFRLNFLFISLISVSDEKWFTRGSIKSAQ